MTAAPHRALRVIAVYKLAKALALLVVAFAAFDLVKSVRLEALAGWIIELPIHHGHHFLVRLVERLLGTSPSKYFALGVAACVYATVFSVEGWGLWRGKRWAEYLTVIVTASLIPLEIWEILHRLTWLKVLALALNLAIVLYLLSLLRRER
jgi:uncharacterized membrane protein (DUF2068 family)